VTLREALAWLDGHVNLETGVGFAAAPTRERGAPTLDRIRELTTLLGTPQAEFPTVHLTGTNGKTSTARMTATLLEATGRSVGLATSPHLEHVRERVVWLIDDVTSGNFGDAKSQLSTVKSDFQALRSSAKKLASSKKSSVQSDLDAVKSTLDGLSSATILSDVQSTLGTAQSQLKKTADSITTTLSC